MNEPIRAGGRPETILLATDLSSRCDRALDRAAQMARDWNARLVVLHVIEPQGDAGGDRPAGAQGDRAAAALAQLRRDLLEEVPRVEVVVESGAPADLIEEVARSTGAGLIVTGVARGEPFGRAFVGNTVLRLGRGSSLPVLVVRTRPRPYREVLVATDFSEPSRHALDVAAALFPEAALTLMHAYEPPFAALADRKALAERLRGFEADAFAHFLSDPPMAPEQRQRIRPVVEHVAPDRAIGAYMRDRGVDLVAIGSHGRSAMFERLIGSVAGRVLAEAPGDVLLVRPPQARGTQTGEAMPEATPAGRG